MDKTINHAISTNNFNLITNTIKDNPDRISILNNLTLYSITNNNLPLTKYCLEQGANNYGECFYCSKNYKNDDAAILITNTVAKKVNKKIDTDDLYNKKQYDKIYEFFNL